MKVIYISHLHPSAKTALKNVGGTQTVSVQILNALEQHADVTVRPVLLNASAKWIELRSIFFLFKLYRTLPKIIETEKADVVFFVSMVTATMAFFLRRKLKIPTVTLNHGHDVIWTFWPYQKLVPKVFKNLDGVISVSESTRQASLARGLQPSKGIVLPNGLLINPQRLYDKHTSREWISAEFNLDLEHKYLLLTVGRQVKRKGHAWFIQEVLPLIESDIVFLLIGEGREAEMLRQLKQHSPHGDRIILAGKVPNPLLQQAYDAADLFLMPNIPVPGDMEGFGVVILEANEARTPAIASALEGIQDVICNGINGYTVEPLHPQKFANKIDEAIRQDLQTLSASSYRYVLQHHQWTMIGNQYVDFFQAAIETRRKTVLDQGPHKSTL
jgi:phosphatidyl-myo-inositol dimannoside synthase